MARMRMSMILLGALILVVISVLSTYLVLLLTHVIPNDPINVEITILDKEKTYDGTPLMADSYEITSGKLLDGHKLDITYLGSITDAGVVKSSAQARVFDDKNTDHTNEYSFTYVEGNLVIKKQILDLYVIKGSNSNENYGASFGLLDDSALCPGHKILPDFTFDNILDDPDTLRVSMTAEVFDVNGHDVTKNYDLRYTSDDIDINKQVISFRTLSRTKVYDGDPFDETQLESTIAYGALPEGYTYDVTYDYRDKGNVGSVSLSIDKVVIKDNYGDDVSNRFDIQKQNTGVLTITPYDFDVVVDDMEYEYDGESHSNNDFNISADPLVRVVSEHTFEYFDKRYSIEVDSDSSTKLTNAGTKVNTLSFIINNDSGDNVTSNFKINQNSAILKVNKAKMVFDAYKKNSTSPIDGTVLLNFNPAEGSNKTKRYNTEWLNNNYEFKNGDVKLTISGFNYKEIYHAGDYQLIPNLYTISDIEEENLKNYEIIINALNIKVARATVNIVIESESYSQGAGTSTLRADVYMEDHLYDYYDYFEDCFDVDVQNVSLDNPGTYKVGCIITKIDTDIDALLEDFNIIISEGLVTVV